MQRLPTSDIAADVLHSLTTVRNTCAHHARLWNRQFTMQLPNIKKLKQHLHIHEISTTSAAGEMSIQQQPDRRLYNHLVVIAHMMKAIQPSTSWQTRLTREVLTLQLHQQAAMGFPENWQGMDFWRGSVAAAGSEVHEDSTEV
ncbi:MAG: Abi family protein [Oceanobacter sp.]